MLTDMRYVDYVLDPRRDHLVSWLREQLATATAAHIRTGFFTAAGLDAVLPDLEAHLKAGGSLRFLLGGDPLQCEPPALWALLRLAEEHPEIVEARVVTRPDFQNAKTYLIEHPDGRRCAWVGSANLTPGGLTNNYEAAIILDSREDDPDTLDRILTAHQAVDELGAARSLTRELIRDLEEARQARDLGTGAITIETPVELDVALQPFVDELDSVASREGDAACLRTGFLDLDACLAGLEPGTLTVIASRPGVGRTTLALDLLRTNAVHGGIPAALFTFESSRQAIMERLFAAEARIRRLDMRAGRMDDAEWTRLAARMAEISEGPMAISSGPAPDLDTLQAAIVEQVRSHHARLVVIDSLNLVVARKFADNREREVAEVARRLKAIAMQLQIAVVATAELSRATDQRKDRRPALSDLRDADAIAQVADLVLLLHRPDAYERDDPRAGEADVIIAKNRNGPPATITVAHQLHYGRFVDLAT